jgi:uncharacterized protein (TIGR02118 family)
MPQPVKVIALIKAKPGMTKEQFKKRWVDEHCPLTIKMKNLRGYRVNIALDEFQDLEDELPYDGTAELWWDSLEEMKEDFASEAGKLAGHDADTFTVTRIHLYMKEYIIT